MSHTMNIKLQIHDSDILKKACQRLGIVQKTGQFKLSSTTENGVGVYLEGWRYPIVIKEDGSVAFDNWGGRWGNIEKLHELEATYGLEKALIESIQKGYLTQETVEGDELVLRVIVGD